MSAKERDRLQLLGMVAALLSTLPEVPKAPRFQLIPVADAEVVGAQLRATF